GHVGIYLCGATVQGSPHVGHLRSGIAFDVLVRWLRRRGLEVTLVRNVTDIDDKILTKSAEAGVPWWAWAYRFEQEFTAAYDAVGVLRPTYEPRATGHVTEMVALIDRLVERGHAYRGEGANVYFDVRSFSEYGGLTRQLLENMSTLDEEEAGDKRDARDFALWETPKDGEPAAASRVGSRRRTPRPPRPPGPPPTGADGPAGTSSARPWPTATSGRASTSTAAASTCASRTTRTRWPSPAPPATTSPSSGCTTPG